MPEEEPGLDCTSRFSRASFLGDAVAWEAGTALTSTLSPQPAGSRTRVVRMRGRRRKLQRGMEQFSLIAQFGFRNTDANRRGVSQRAAPRCGELVAQIKRTPQSRRRRIL